MILTALVLVPLLASGACFLLPSRRWLELVTVISALLVLVCAILAAGQVMANGHLAELADWLYADALSALTLLIIAFVSCLSVLYSIGYLREDMREQNVTQGNGLRQGRRYYLLFNLFVF